MKAYSRIIRSTLLVAGLGISLLLANYMLIGVFTKDMYSRELADVPNKKVALVLGTSEFLTNGRTNLYFKYRVDAVVELWEAGKISFVLVSGDNSRADYDEPNAFKNALMARGISSESIFLDFAGFRTLDSVVRAKKVFGQTDIIIVSQAFHEERALILASFKGLKAYGYAAKDVKIRAGLKTKLRENLARVKLWLDLLFHVGPKFLGEPITIN
jgi:SanA protein